MPSFEAFFQSVQKACLPGVWSKGVALARESSIFEDHRKDDEILLRIQLLNRPVSPRVTLWPQDEDWHCDCGDRNDPCLHIAAAVVALKNGAVQKSGPKVGDPGGTAATGAPRLGYRFRRDAGTLCFERWIIRGGADERLTTSLVSLAGGISSGRIAMPPVAATREDYAIDQIIGAPPRERLDRATLFRLLMALKGVAGLTLDGEAVEVGPSIAAYRAVLSDEGQGFRLKILPDPSIQEVFADGAALAAGILRPVPELEWTQEERQWLAGEAGRFIARKDVPYFVSGILPALESKMPLEIRTERLPRIERARPRAVLRLEALSEESLSVVASLVYGDPPIAELRENQLETLRPDVVPARDPLAEKDWIRKLQSELHLHPGQYVKLEGEQAVRFRAKLRGWEVSGHGAQAFAATESLGTRIEASDLGFELVFETPGGRAASTSRVLQAWRENQSYAPLTGGGWAKLPGDWLSRYGDRIQALMDARDATTRRLPPVALPELIDLCDELHQPYPESLKKLKARLQDFEAIPETPLPQDLRAELRSYQRRGYDWLCFLRETGMGAMLADDMGLGKTLQALASLRGRTLIVAPTSVLASWAEQIERFRPGLAFHHYYGPERKLPGDCPIVLTTYGVLRLDQERLGGENWDTIILDETQTIKNPDSQIARAAHRLRGKFRIALSGTPIENRLEDLWSQFQFINPGLLGPREDPDLPTLRRKVRPFILRRLKKDVAPELPPRTESVLHCELSKEERDLYDSILASTRAEVLAQLESGGSVLGALEALLRLRQACCHPALVPGQEAAAGASSAKLDLLMQTLGDSIALGHRALVFSQWTSYLDLIEPALSRAGVSFCRLDGTTRDRDAIVRRFQAPDGPSAMLISLKAGGTGLTLTAADHVYILDPWWNPAVEDQASDRAHRIGQENPVLIHRLVAKDTVEDRILILQKNKRRLAEAVLEGSAQVTSITREELAELLGAY